VGLLTHGTRPAASILKVG